MRLRIGIVVSKWHEEYTSVMLEKCKNTLIDEGVQKNDIVTLQVSGTFEIPFGAKALIERHTLDAVIAIGCLIKGETMHFEYIAEEVARGIMQIGLETGVPVIFGVLTCLTEKQARDRSLGKKSLAADWGKTAIEMARLRIER